MKLPLRLFLLASVLLLPGCGGVKDWVVKTFDQGKLHKENKKTVDSCLRSIKIYDQFTTVALFNALWISDEIRTLYANTYASMYGRSEEVRKTFLRRQLKANTQLISFYVLSTHEIPLNEKPAKWVMYLKVNGKSYSPVEVKAVELAPEYKLFFGKYLTNHKRPYEVRFDRKDTNGNDILENTDTLELYFSGPHHFSSMEWNDIKHDCFKVTEHKKDETSNRE